MAKTKGCFNSLSKLSMATGIPDVVQRSFLIDMLTAEFMLFVCSKKTPKKCGH